MDTQQQTKMIKRLNTTLPDPLAYYVGVITGKGGDYETPSEFIRDLVRRHMEQAEVKEEQKIQTMLAQSMAENDYSPWTDQDIKEARDLVKG